MDRSTYGYLSRRSKEELERIIAVYWPLKENDYYKDILDIEKHFLEECLSERDV